VSAIIEVDGFQAEYDGSQTVTPQRLSAALRSAPRLVVNLLATPPEQPTFGDRYLVISGATGEWSTRVGRIALWAGDAWAYVIPFEGLTVWSDGDEQALTYSQGVWHVVPIGSHGSMGFELHTDGTPAVTLSYSATDRKVTVTAKSGSTFTIWVSGSPVVVSSPHVSTAHSATTASYFYSHDGSGFAWSTSFWDLMTKAPVALVYYEATTAASGVGFLETHTVSRDPAIHRRLHEVEGTALVSGGVLSGYTLNTDSDAGVTFGISECVVADEDLHTTIAALTDASSYTIWYRLGVSGYWTWTTNTLPWTVATYPKLNTFSTTWDLRAMESGDFGTYYVLATPSVTSGHGFIVIPGQTIYANEALANAETFSSLSLSGLAGGALQEFVLLAKIVVGTLASYGGTSKSRVKSVTSYTGTRVSATSSTSTQHNALSGLQGGVAGSYYHLTTGGTSFPASPFVGMNFLRTDLGETFVWDGANWLGPTFTLTFGGAGDTADGSALETTGGVVSSDTLGYFLPFSARLIGASFTRSNAVEGDIEINGDGALLGKLTIGTASEGFDMAIGVAIDSETILSAVWNASTTGVLSDAVVVLFLKQQAT
jgi:hypothetical protein